MHDVVGGEWGCIASVFLKLRHQVDVSAYPSSATALSSEKERRALTEQSNRNIKKDFVDTMISNLFTRITLQLKWAIEISWWLVHYNFEKYSKLRKSQTILKSKKIGPYDLNCFGELRNIYLYFMCI
jgi:hypothetical protein